MLYALGNPATGENSIKVYEILASLLTSLALFGATHVHAQLPMPYGAPISNGQAKKHSRNVVIAVVNSGGNQMMLQRLDGIQFDSADVTRDKAHAAAAFRRPAKVFQDPIAQGGGHLRMLNLTGGTAGVLEGGVPIAGAPSTKKRSSRAPHFF